jgi:histidine ammonia-lyase
VDDSFRLVAQEALSATYWMNVRSAQKSTRSFGGPPNAAWQSLRAVVPWQSDSRPEIPPGDLVYAFMLGNPASAFMGGAQDPAVEVRMATKRAQRAMKTRRATLHRQVRNR